MVSVRPASVPESPITARLSVSSTGETQAVGPYRVVQRLGQGGMGTVYEVVDEAGGRYALKIVEMRFVESGDGTVGRRFSHEVAILSKLAHPGIVRFHAYGYARHPQEGTELGFFLMERLYGKTLDELITAGRRFSPSEAVEVIGLLAQALQYLDDANVLHRDIKPSNLFVEAGGRTVLMDFGLARSEELTRLTAAGQVIGTASYMSPERLCGMASDIKADVYSLGVVLFEMLTGALPFSATDPTTLVKEIRRGVSWPVSLASEEGANFQALVRSMLAPDPKARPRPHDVIKRLLSIRSEGTVAESTISDDKSMVATFTLGPQGFTDNRDTKPSPSATQLPALGSAPPPPSMHQGPSWPVAAALSVVTFLGGLLVGVVGRTPVEPDKVPVPVPVTKQAPPPKPTPKPGAAPIEMPKFANADEAYAYGDKALEDGRTEEGIRALRRAIELNITHADAYRRLGIGLLTAGRAEEAAEKLDMYLKLRPTAEDAAQVKKLLNAIRPK